MKLSFILVTLLLFIISLNLIYTKSLEEFNELGAQEQLEELDTYNLDEINQQLNIENIRDLNEADDVPRGETNARLNYERSQKAHCANLGCPKDYPCTDGQCLMKCGRVYCIRGTACEKDFSQVHKMSTTTKRTQSTDKNSNNGANSDTKIDVKNITKPVKVTLYDSTTIKQTLDDSLVKYVKDELKFNQDQTTNYQKVTLGAFGCVMAAIAQFYPLPHPKNKPILILCVFVYVILSLCIQFIDHFIQKDYILFAYKNDGKTSLKAASNMIKYDPNYTLKIEYKSGAPSNHNLSIDSYFDTNGNFIEHLYHSDLSKIFKKILDKIN
ncbi:microsomal signal peptidase subunit [Tieghemostelium lacteum]|uniref:Signal peptidase complex subunit 2 n=1 Tax=Tieghemostelium lacteum TaxID=361077 RepID=A0A151Z3G0_TIELA|nr:microsomal signal peptidase subunit [Tieghemostelium lacteum]|eukprot:KYQ88479.1 microsomal signal peptidase subunit [Tieghemostelium lacteum]